MRKIIYSKKFIHKGLTFDIKDITNARDGSSIYGSTFYLYGHIDDIKIKTTKPREYEYYYDSDNEAIKDKLWTAVDNLGVIKEAIQQINYWLTRVDIMTELKTLPNLKFAGHFTISLKDNIATITLPLCFHFQIQAKFDTTTTDLQTVANKLLKAITQVRNLVITETDKY